MLTTPIHSIQPLIFGEAPHIELSVTMKNHFRQPIQTFELFASPKKNPLDSTPLWKTSLKEGEEQQVSISIPINAVRKDHNPPSYSLYYRVELEDGHGTFGHLVVPCTQSELSLQGSWSYAYSTWPFDDEPYLVMQIGPE